MKYVSSEKINCLWNLLNKSPCQHLKYYIWIQNPATADSWQLQLALPTNLWNVKQMFGSCGVFSKISGFSSRTCFYRIAWWALSDATNCSIVVVGSDLQCSPPSPARARASVVQTGCVPIPNTWQLTIGAFLFCGISVSVPWQRWWSMLALLLLGLRESTQWPLVIDQGITCDNTHTRHTPAHANTTWKPPAMLLQTCTGTHWALEQPPHQWAHKYKWKPVADRQHCLCWPSVIRVPVLQDRS